MISSEVSCIIIVVFEKLSKSVILRERSDRRISLRINSAKNLCKHKFETLHGVYREPLRSAQGDSTKSESVQGDKNGFSIIIKEVLCPKAIF